MNPSQIESTFKPDAVDRRKTLGTATKLGAGLALGMLPTLMAPRKAYARAHDVLNFALTLEYLEAEYYQMGLATPGLIPASARPIFQQISKHEDAHVALLRTVLNGIAPPGPVDKPTFDFTAGGAFNPFEDYGIFLALSQGFEDTGVRAYKGQAGNIPADAEYEGINLLTAALQIHSVEARHAAMVRRLRGPGNAQPDGWIAFDRTNVPALQAVYDGEDQTVQGGVDLTQVTSKSAELITESFDEPLTRDEVLAIAGMFIQS